MSRNAKAGPKLLKNLTKPQVMHVAAVLYETPLSLQSNLSVLKAQVEEVMRAVTDCDNEACRPAGLPSGPCVPEKHLFSVSQYVVAGNNSGVNTLNELVDTQQNDSMVSNPESDDGLNPRADILKQRRDLVTATLAQQGLQLSDLAELFSTQQSGSTLPGSTPAPRIPPQPTPRSLSTPAVVGGNGQAHRSLFQNQQHVPPAAPPPAADATLSDQSMLSQMMAVLRQNAADRAEELKIREAQTDNTTKLLELVTRRMDAADAAPVAGRVEMVQPRNDAALLMTGVALPAQFSVVGNTANMDLSKSKYKLKSGLAPAAQQAPRVAEVWPHYYLDPLLVEHEVLHEKLTFSQWCQGFVTKIFSEIDPSRNFSREHNMLHILMLMLRLAETHPWSDVRKLDETLFLALERGVLSWDSWEPLEKWWSRAESTLRNKATLGASRPAGQPSKRPAGQQDSGEQPAPKKKKGDVVGLSGDWLRKNGLCIKFQLGTCSVVATQHEIPQQGNTIQVRHACAGCIWLKKGEDSSHGAKACKHKNHEGVFC